MNHMRQLFARRIIPVMGALVLSGATPGEASDPALDPYVDFLRAQETSARDYVIGLFDDHDLVILCERDHRDITQYDLFLSVLEDPRFVDRVGRVFTEVGVRSLNPELNAFLHASNLPADSVDRLVLHFQRNCSWSPLWYNKNFSYFLRGIHRINRGLSPDRMISMYPSDIPFEWAGADSTRVAELRQKLDARDRIMADQIAEQFDGLRPGGAAQAKALVIMNFRHAFSRHMELPGGRTRHNVGAYLRERYGDRVANVYVNFARIQPGSTDRNTSLGAIQDGIWDASFQALARDDVGFDFAGTPFGEDGFDIWPVEGHGLSYQDVFTGFVYFRPPDAFRCVVGVEGLVDTAFVPELRRRRALDRRVSGEAPRDTVPTADLIRQFSTEAAYPEQDLDSIQAQIARWLP